MNNIELLALSEKAKQVCKIFNVTSQTCGKCPLRPACVGGHTCNRQGFDAWTAKINNLAETIDLK